MVGFFGDLSDLVSSVTTVVTTVSKEVVSDVKVAVKELQQQQPDNNNNNNNDNQKIPAAPAPAPTTPTTSSSTVPKGNDGGRNPPPPPPTSTTTSSSRGAKIIIPTSLDLCYVTDNLLVMPQPTVDAWTAKCYFEKKEQQQEEEEDQKQQQNQGGDRQQQQQEVEEKKKLTEETQEGEEDPKEADNNNNNDNTGKATSTSPTTTPKTNNNNYIPFTPTVVPHRNDVIVLAEYLEQEGEEQNHSQSQSNNNGNDVMVFNISDTPAEDTIVRALSGQIVQLPWMSPSSPRSETPSLSAMLDIVYCLASYLHCLDLNLDDDDDETETTPTPKTPTPTAKAIVYCENGKTRTALVVACYLAYVGLVRTVREGFLYFLLQTQPTTIKTIEEAIPLWEKSCPPSIRTFATNFDQTIKFGQYHNPKPLLLRAIALQGIPVEDKPCLDIWDAQQRHIYSSHPQLWTDLVDSEQIESLEWENSVSLPIAEQPPSLLEQQQEAQQQQQFEYYNDELLQEAMSTPLPKPATNEEDDWMNIHLTAHPNNLESYHVGGGGGGRNGTSIGQQLSQHQQQLITSQWADEEGFFRVNVVLEGDFCLLCRFGGEHAESDKDNTKILFRYANTTTNMGGGQPYELRAPSQIDLMKRYASCFDPDDFLCTLLLDSYWNAPEVYWQERLNRPCQRLPPVYKFYNRHHHNSYYADEYIYDPDQLRLMFQRGWHLLQQYSVVQPTSEQIQQLLELLQQQQQQQHQQQQQQENVDVDNSNDNEGVDVAVGNDDGDDDNESNQNDATSSSGNNNNNDNDDDDNKASSNTKTGMSTSSTTGIVISTEMAKLCLQRSNLNLEDALQSLTSINEDPTCVTARLRQLLHQEEEPTPPSSPRSLQKPSTNQQKPLPEKKEEEAPLPPPQEAPLTPLSKKEQEKDDTEETEEEEEEEEDLLDEEAYNILDILDSVDFGDEFKGNEVNYGYDFSGLQRPQRDRNKNNKKKKDEGNDGDGTKRKKTVKKTTSSCSSTRRKSAAAVPPVPQVSYRSPHMQMPRQGEILDAFGEYYDDIHNRKKGNSSSFYDNSRPLVMGESIPQIPLHVSRRSTDEPYVPIDDPNNAAAMDLLLKMNHSGVNLHDLTELLQDSRYWNKPQPVIEVEEEEKKTEEGVLEAMGTGGASAAAAAAASAAAVKSGPAPPIKDHPQFSKYFKQIKAGAPLEEVKEAMKKDGKDPTIADLDPEKSLSSQRPNMADQEAVVTAPNAVENAQKALQEALLRKKSGPKKEVVIPKRGEEKETEEKEENPQAKLMAALKRSKSSDSQNKDEDMPLRTDPDYSKYFKMLKMGMSKEQIQHAMKSDEKDPTIIELDPERSLKAQRTPLPKEKSDDKDDDPPLKEDPEYGKYMKMLKMGMPKAQVLHALTRDGKDPTVLDLDPERSLKSQQQPKAGSDDGPPLKDDEEYKKYFRMLKMGMAKEQVVHALQRDGKDPKILDLDPEKSLKSQQAKAGRDDGPPLKDDPEYAKYFKMLSMKLPKAAVKNALVRDGKDPSIIDLDPEKSIKSQLGGGDAPKDEGPPLKEDPQYQKYFKMMSMGLPKDAVKNALVRDGKDPSIMDLDPEKSIKSQLGGGDAPKDEGPPLKEDPEFQKYFKMMSMGLPKDAVKNALVRDGKDPSIMDLDPERSLKFQMGGGGEEEKDIGTPLKDDPEYSKYMKMMSMGLPKDAVKNALARDGKDPAIMDLDPNKSVEFQMKKKSSASSRRTPMKKKKKVRRKKIYWNPIEADQIKEDSIWNLVKGSVKMDSLNYDVKEFEDLFTESADPADRKKNKRKKTDTSKQKKSVQVIDGKRSMNGGIILARMKVDYSKIASSVNEMQHRKFDATQMKALKEFLPTIDERQGLKMFMKNGEKDPAVKEQLYKDLSECEKYMYTMIDVPKASEKFDCMLFRNQFKNRFEELLDSIKTIETACDETRNSERLRKMMATILTLVNQINTGGEGKVAAGFGLDALLKLNEAKAFDKKTSVLMYLAKLVKKNDASLLGFQEDLANARHAENIVLDTLVSDIKTIEGDLQKVHATAAEEAARLEANGELRPFSLSELKELKTTVYSLGGVQHFNKVDHQSGRTPMERFALNSQDALKQATSKIDLLKQKYQSLLLYFGEDEKMPSNEFFGLMRRFIEEFQKANDMVEKMETQRIKEEKRNAKRAERRKTVSAATLPSKDAMANLAKKAVARKSAFALGSRDGKGAASGMGGIAAIAAAAAAGIKDGPNQAPGGIGALAALAASKKKGNAAPSSQGGIGALAALAASKRAEAAPPAGGIAALAAMAAKGKADNKKTPQGGGLAAMAAMSSKKKGVSPTPSASGGLAVMAAMAGKKKESTAPAPSGLAAMAAMASKKKGVSPTPSASGGLAAMAAMASKKKESTAPTPGGLAAMAAMASKKKGVSPTPSASGGLAAMAAMASKKKESTAPAPGGLAAMAAMASKKKGDKSVPSASGGLAAMAAASKPAQPPGGIAAMAAMAAKKKATPPAPGGIASMAAMSAQKKGASSAAVKEPAPAAGGIATMAGVSKSNSGLPRVATVSRSPSGRGSLTRSRSGDSTNSSGLPRVARISKAPEARKSLTRSRSGDSTNSSPGKAMVSRSTSGGLPRVATVPKASKSTAPGLAKSNSGKTGAGAGASGLARMASSARSRMGLGGSSSSKGPPSSRGVSPSHSDADRKRKVYDEKSGLYSDIKGSAASGFGAKPSDILFQMGSSGRSKSPAGRTTPTRSKSSGGVGSKPTPTRSMSGDGLARVPHRTPIRSTSSGKKGPAQRTNSFGSGAGRSPGGRASQGRGGRGGRGPAGTG